MTNKSKEAIQPKEFPGEPLSQTLDNILRQAKLAEPFAFWRINPDMTKFLQHTLEIILRKKGIGIDYRAPIATEKQAEVVVAPTSEGLAFDPKRVRSQTFLLHDRSLTDYLVEHLGEQQNNTLSVLTLPKAKPDKSQAIQSYFNQTEARILQEVPAVIGVMTLVIAPRTYIEQQRYFQITNDGGYSQIQLVDFHTAHYLDRQLPVNYLMIPGWTKVLPQYRTKFALSGFRALNTMLDHMASSAPDGTYLEVGVRGNITKNEARALIDLANESELQSPFCLIDDDLSQRMIQAHANAATSVKLASKFLQASYQAGQFSSNDQVTPIMGGVPYIVKLS